MSWSQQPGFVESLRLLVEEERYSLTDVGLMFGVSRERVSQWCARHAIAHAGRRGWCLGLRAERVWDGERFRPIVPVLQEARSEDAARARRAHRRPALAERVAERRARLTAIVARLHGTSVSWRALAEAYAGRPVPQNGACPLVLGAWRLPGVTTAEARADFCAQTGYVPRHRGGWRRPTVHLPDGFHL